MARWIGLYSPGRLRDGVGAVTHLAEVISVEIKTRGEIHTPWKRTHRADAPMLLFHLRPLKEKDPPILNSDRRRMPVRTWSSRLAVDRAEKLGQLSMETEPEWRLHEQLVLNGIAFRIEAGEARLPDPEDPRGRALFKGAGWTVRYDGKKGFCVTWTATEREAWIDRVEDVLAAVTAV